MSSPSVPIPAPAASAAASPDPGGGLGARLRAWLERRPGSSTAATAGPAEPDPHAPVRSVIDPREIYLA